MFPAQLRATTFLLAAFLLVSSSYRAHAVDAEAVAGAPHRALAFERNRGQAPPDFQFVSRTREFTALLRSDGVVFSLPARRLASGRTSERQLGVVSMHFAASNGQAAPTAEEQFAGRSNYLLGKDAQQWLTGIEEYGKVTYMSVYPKIDVAYYGSEQALEYDFQVAPRGEPGRIRLHFQGQDRLEIDAAGNLVLHAGDGALRLEKPLASQEHAGSTQQVDARFVKVNSNEVGISIGRYDHALPLVIDPKLTYSTYLGGAADEGIFGIAFDPEGNIYVAGETSSLNFPTRGAPQPQVGGGYDAFVSKFDRTGTRLIYSTYLGGSGYDHAVGIAVDATGSAYLAGVTQSPDFPTRHALQSKFGGISDAFVARLDPSGASLIYSTYLGGAGRDGANGITIDAAGNAFITGQTQSLDFPTTTNALQPHCGGAEGGFCSGDAFVAEYSPAGSALLYSTYFGGSATDSASAIAVDDKGSIYIVGQTYSKDLPVKDAFQSQIAGLADAFVAKLSPSSQGLLYATFLGGKSFDGGQDIAVDAAHNMYVTGTTSSADFPTVGAFQAKFAGQIDAFVAKIQADGAALSYSTYLGGSNIDYPIRIALDAAGNASITGFTYSTNYPVAHALSPAYLGGASDAFLSRLDPTGAKLVFSSYLGGAGDDFGYAISTDLTGALWVGGSTSSQNLTLQHPFQKQYGGGPYDAFFEKVSLDPADALNVLGAGVGNYVATAQLNQSAGAPLRYEIKLAEEALQAHDTLLAAIALAAFEATLLDDCNTGQIQEALALRLGFAGYDILGRIY